MPRVLVREMAAGEEPAVTRLLERSFGAWPPYAIAVDAAEHLRWKVVPRPAVHISSGDSDHV